MPSAKVNRWIDENGVETAIELEYEVYGPVDGDVVLLISGLGNQMLQWGFHSVVTPLVNAGYRVIRVDNRDSGKSTYLPKRAVSSIEVRLKTIASGWTDYVSSFFTSVAEADVSSHDDQDTPPSPTPDDDYDLSAQLTPIPGKAPIPVRPPPSGLSHALGLAPPPPYYELADMAIDLWNLLNVLGVERAHIMGASMGGMITEVSSEGE